MGNGRWLAAVPGMSQGDLDDHRHDFRRDPQAAATWFLAMWFVTSQKNGVSALGLQRALGLGSYETSWTWLHKLRRAMVRPGRDRLAGEIEADETYVGGPEEGKRDREVESKAIVAVAAEQRGRGIGASAFGASRTSPPRACWPSCKKP